MNPVDLRLYGILGPANARGRDLAALAAAAAAGGCTLIQLRDKDGSDEAVLAQARAIKAALAGSGVPLLVNDRVDVAAAAGADGVHLGQDDVDPREARARLGPAAIIGVTLKTPAHAEALTGLPVDYGCIGGVFATASKRNLEPPIGLDGLARVLAAGRPAGLPLGAIAGIDESNAAPVIGTGADGIAVISALFDRDDVTGAARRLKGIVDRALAARRA
ncbi:MAG TPA: thiamine phosphate synthase [Salinarimonas sp.]|nr:thiamine phosphate synthase [Salinarimonas sp.]